LADLDLIGDLDEALNNLKPVSDPYQDFYNGAMQRLQAHGTGKTNIALITICWLFFAKRTLRQKELLHALAFSGCNSQADEKRIPTVSYVLSLCAGLVVIDEINDTVSLFHKTLHDFLEKSHASFFPLGNEAIGKTCVRYLSLDAFADGPCPVVDPASLWSVDKANDRTILYKGRLNRFSLYEYASKYWHDHVRGGDLEIAETVTTFLGDENKLSASCQTLQCLVPRTTGVHAAVRFSLSNALDRHLELYQPRLDVKDNFGRSPISYAAETNNLVAANRLIEAGADPNVQDDRSAARTLKAYNPLSYAAALGHCQMVELLCKKGACVDQQDYRGRSALSYAAQHASEAVVRVLLEHGSTVDSHDSANRTPVCYAAGAGSAEVVSALVDHGADVNQADSRQVTPLLLAARAGSQHTISLLIAKGAKVNLKCSDSDTPLSRAVEARLIDSVRLLLRMGAEVDVYTSPEDPLSQACMTGPKEIIPLLLSAGGNVKHLNNRRVPPLACVARNGWLDMVQLFLDKGAAADYVDRKDRSVLSYAVEGGSTDCVELLLKRGADITRVNRYLSFCEQIYYALGMKHYNDGGTDPSPADEHMLKVLLSRGASPNRLVATKRSAFALGSPLFYAIQRLPIGDPSSKRVLELLLQYGAKFDEEDEKELVLTCAKHHSFDVQDLLHQYGAI